MTFDNIKLIIELINKPVRKLPFLEKKFESDIVKRMSSITLCAVLHYFHPVNNKKKE